MVEDSLDETQRQEPVATDVDVPLSEAEPTSRGMLTDPQLESIVENFSSLCPDGYLRVYDMADALAELLSNDGDSAWVGLDVKRFRKGVRSHEICQSGYVNWREVVLSLLTAKYGILAQATPKMMADSVQVNNKRRQLICELS